MCPILTQESRTAMSDEQLLSLMGQRDAAIRLGELRANEMIELANQLQALQREIKRVIKLLETGRPDDALRLLQSLSRNK
jgi:hypothetical protein